MIIMILASDQYGGIGLNGKLPWNIPEELQHFKKITDGHKLIFGSKSYRKLKNRECLKMSSHLYIDPKETYYICGGAITYNSFIDSASIVHFSIIRGKYNADTHIEISDYQQRFTVQTLTSYDKFIYYKLVCIPNTNEFAFLQLLRKVSVSGNVRETRNSITKSIFGATMEFDLTEGFPLMTTRQMFFKGIVLELLFFIRGETNTKVLEDQYVYIWKENTKETNGDMGPMYGYQWRNFNGVDQLKKLINQIKTDPHSRRLLITTFNPADAEKGVLYPCHSIVNQFYVENNYLSMQCYNRSQDMFLGCPWNIASSALLLSIIAKLTNKVAKKLIINCGDCHIYENHYQAVDEQLSRFPFQCPKIEIDKLDDIEEYQASNIKLINYNHCDKIAAKMIA